MSDDEIKLGRVGHYSTSDQECHEATIVAVLPRAFDSDSGELPRVVNIHGHTSEGESVTRTGVRVGPFGGPDPEFHLNRSCPWGR